MEKRSRNTLIIIIIIARYKVFVSTRADKSTRLLLFCEFVSRPAPDPQPQRNDSFAQL